MTNLRRVGAAGAFLQTAYFVILLLFLFVLLPGQGFDPTEENFHNAAVALPFAAHSPLRALDDLRDILLGVGVLMAGVAVFELWSERARGMLRLGLVFAIAAGALLLGSGITGYSTTPTLAALYLAGRTADAGGAYLAITLVTGGLRLAGFFAYGVWALLASLGELRLDTLPRAHAFLGMVMGIGLSLAWLVGNVAAVVGLVAALVWTAWLGVWLHTRKPEVVHSMPL